MPTYTVHAPAPKDGENASAPERFVFVRDGFHFWAFLLTPLWLLVHRLWLGFIAYVVLGVLLELTMHYARVAPNVQLLVGVTFALLMGFEAASIRRWTLSRRGWSQVGFVVAEDEEMAEQRFYVEWSNRSVATTDEPPLPPPSYATPVRRGPPSGNDVIGLFPEPGGSR